MAKESSKRGKKSKSKELIIVYSNSQAAPDAISTYKSFTALLSPDYYIDSNGVVSNFLNPSSSSQVIWLGKTQDVNKISISIGLEHTPGSIYPQRQLLSLYNLIDQLQDENTKLCNRVFRWESAPNKPELGVLSLLILPPRPPDWIFSSDEERGLVFEHFSESDIEYPKDDPLILCSLPNTTLEHADILSLTNEADGNVDINEVLWLMLQRESYRQRGEGFMNDWSFHQYATSRNLGFPLAPTAPKPRWIEWNGKKYGFQPFARDTLFNEGENWSAIRSLNDILNGQIPKNGLGRQLLEATYQANGFPFIEWYSTHHVAVKLNLGAPLSGNYAITINNKNYGMQIFAGDILYSHESDWEKVFQLSKTTDSNISDALWGEAYKICGGFYEPNHPFHQQVIQEQNGTRPLGIPLSKLYQVDFEGTRLEIQVFTYDTLFTGPGIGIKRQSDLFKPKPEHDDRLIALSDKRPTFNLLPLPGRPNISQFFGYTKFASGPSGQPLYGQTQGRHSGIDFSVPVGTQLIAMQHGLVVGAGIPGSPDCPFGGCPPQTILVRYGAVYAIYGHVSAIYVGKGQLVHPGEVLGLSGYPSAPHLHFELRPVPNSLLSNTDLNQPAINSGESFNPLDCFITDLKSYFDSCYQRLGGIQHFCCDDLHTQGIIKFGSQIDQRICENR